MEGKPKYFQRTVEYAKGGDCGSVLVAVATNKFKIIGLLTAGYPGQPISLYNPLEREFFRKWIYTHEGKRYCVPRVFPHYQVGDTVYGSKHVIKELYKNSALKYIGPHTCITAIGTVKTHDASFSKYRVKQTELYSLVCEHFESVRDFALPHMKTPKVDGKFVPALSPGKNAIRTINGPKDFISIETSRKAWTDLIVQVLAVFKNPGILSNEQAIRGDSLLGLSPLKMTTSAGFPYTGTKMSLFDLELDGYVAGERITQDLLEAERVLATGTQIGFVAKLSLKEELVSQKKRDTGNTRGFAAVNVLCSLLVRKYFGSLIAWWSNFNNSISTESAVGIDAASTQWSYLYQRLKTHKKYLGIDYSKFDKGISATTMKGVCSFCLRSLAGVASNREMQIARTLLQSLLHSLYMWKGDIFTARGNTNLSGLPVTTFFNCVINMYYMRCFYYELKCPPPYKDHVVAFTFGDDLIASTDIPQFNFSAIKRVATGMCIRVTPYDKSDEVSDFHDLTKLTFLGKFFVEKNGIVRCPLVEKSQMRSIAWFTESREDIALIEVRQSTFSSWYTSMLQQNLSFKLRTIVLIDALYDEYLGYDPSDMVNTSLATPCRECVKRAFREDVCPSTAILEYKGNDLNSFSNLCDCFSD
jgi:hypothetical protein